MDSSITLESSDLKRFSVPESVAIQSGTIKQMIKGGCASEPIPLYHVHSETLVKMISYFEKHADESLSPDKLTSFDEEFVDVSPKELFGLIVAADYLNVPSLHDIVIKKVASLIEGKSPMWIHEMLNIQNSGYTKEEEAEVIAKTCWRLN